MRTEDFIAKDGKRIALSVWDEVENPKAVVQMVHGMSEHIGRYAELAEFLNSNGFIAVGDDHRCHGKTDENRLGIVGKEESVCFFTVSDEIEITELIKKRYGLPIVLFGHSYGSFISQAYLLQNSEAVTGCILMGTAKQPSATVNFALLAAKLKCRKNSEKAGTFFENKTFKIYDRKINDGTNGWLSRDKESNARYAADKLCGFACSNGFYKSMFEGLKYLNKSSFKEIKHKLPMLILYGTCDYVGGCGKYVKSLAKKYRKAGITDLKVVAYEGARHELLNETCKKQVFGDMLNFIESVVSKS